MVLMAPSATQNQMYNTHTHKHTYTHGHIHTYTRENQQRLAMKGHEIKKSNAKLNIQVSGSHRIQHGMVDKRKPQADMSTSR